MDAIGELLSQMEAENEETTRLIGHWREKAKAKHAEIGLPFHRADRLFDYIKAKERSMKTEMQWNGLYYQYRVVDSEGYLYNPATNTQEGADELLKRLTALAEDKSLEPRRRRLSPKRSE